MSDPLERALSSADVLARVFEPTNDIRQSSSLVTDVAAAAAADLVALSCPSVSSLSADDLLSVALTGQSADNCGDVVDLTIGRLLSLKRSSSLTLRSRLLSDSRRVRRVVEARFSSARADDRFPIRTPTALSIRPQSPPPPPLPTHDELYRHYVALGNPLHLAYAYAQFWEQTARNMANETAQRKRLSERALKRSRDIAEWSALPSPLKPAVSSGDLHYRKTATIKLVRDGSDEPKRTAKETGFVSPPQDNAKTVASTDPTSTDT